MEISELLDKEPRIILLEKFTELQEHSYRQLNKIGKTNCQNKLNKKKYRNHKKKNTETHPCFNFRLHLALGQLA